MNTSRLLPSLLRTGARLRPTPARAFSAGAPRASVPWPLVTEVSSEGWRTHDIFSKLLQERIVCLSGTIDDSLSISIVTQLLWLESDNPEKPITMYINSPGGSVSSGLAIYDTMEYITAPVSTVCIGAASSMAALLLTGGAAGKRFALPHSSVMIHQPLGGTQGQASDILIYATQMQRIREQVNRIYQKHLNRAVGYDKYNLEAINEVMERDKYMTAEEAKEYGIIDGILGKRGEEKDVKEGEKKEGEKKEGEKKEGEKKEGDKKEGDKKADDKKTDDKKSEDTKGPKE